MKIKKPAAILMAVITVTLISAYVLPESNAIVLNSINTVKALNDSTVTDTTKVTYTCPMHPEVTSTNPGQCPKCGMDLVLKKKEDKEQGTIYTCPMHTEVTSDKPGQCPKCGMDLVPKKTEGKDEGMNCPDMKQCKKISCDMDQCKLRAGGCTDKCPVMKNKGHDHNSNEHNHKSGCMKKN